MGEGDSMFSRKACCVAVGIVVATLLVAGPLAAAITPEQRKEIAEVKKDLAKIGSLVAKKQLADAQSLLTNAEDKLKAIAAQDDSAETDRILAPIFQQLAAKKALVEKKNSGKGGGADANVSSSPTHLPPPLAKPIGGETVSFVRDVAPFVVNLCTVCHGDSKPAGELSLTTFDGIRKGGESGRIIDPEDWEKSLLWQLVGLQEPVKMPKGPAQLTAKNLDDLETWLKEGARFDGASSKAPLRNLVPTEEQIRASALSKLSAEEFVKMREEKSLSQWKRANPSQTPASLQTDELILFGDVGEERLKTVAEWSEEQIRSLRATFDNKTSPIWRGKLAIFVFGTRFAFEEFPRVIEGKEVSREVIGLSKVTAGFDDAYVCLQDVGDEVTSSSSGLHLNLIDHLTGAYLKACEKPLPDWLVRGMGIALIMRTEKKNDFLQSSNSRAAQAVRSLEKPGDVFANGTFAPAELEAVGCTLVSYLMRKRDVPAFVKFVSRMQSGSDLNVALKTVYNADSQAIAASYVSTFAGVGPKKAVRKKK